MKLASTVLLFALVTVLSPLGSAAIAQAPLPPQHYKCWMIKSKFEKVTVELKDQFGLSDSTLVKRELLCNPVEKIHNGVASPIADPDLHYVCYKIVERSRRTPDVQIKDQFGAPEVGVQQARLLCAPAAKRELP
jgi:hypothetical protein